jgi:hypothetical protein
LFFSEDHHDLDYISSLLDDDNPGESLWIGIDNRAKSGWTTSLNQKYSKDSAFFEPDLKPKTGCGYVKSGSGGFVSSRNCNLKHHYVCETKQLWEAPDYPCPNEYIPYKDKCLMPSPQRKTFDSAQVFCAARGGIILPVKDKGTFKFIKAWGPQTVRNDVWVGFRPKNVTRTYDKETAPYLLETTTDELTYSDGEPFDIDTDYKLEAKALKGNQGCFALKSSADMELRDEKCSREIGFICQWVDVKCPMEAEYEYSHLGQISSGRDCHGVGEAAAFEDGTCNSENDLLRKRWTPKDPFEIDLFRRSCG